MIYRISPCQKRNSQKLAMFAQKKQPVVPVMSGPKFVDHQNAKNPKPFPRMSYPLVMTDSLLLDIAIGKK
jgi:hypothetical protein